MIGTDRSGRRDRRGVSPVIGVLLMLAVAMLALSAVQTTAIPAMNAEHEFQHNERLQTDVTELASAVDRVASTGIGEAVTLDVGLRYPQRLFFINPPPVAGSLRTTAPATVTIRNATATGETGDYWDGSARTLTTRSVRFALSYNEYDGAPVTVAEPWAVSNRFGDRTLALSGTDLVDGRRISLVTFSGRYNRSSTSSLSPGLRPTSAPVRTVSVSGSLELSVPTRLANDTWATLLEDELTSDGGSVARFRCRAEPPEPCGELTLSFVPGTYTLSLGSVAVGSGAGSPEPAYLTAVEGAGSSVPETGQRQVVVEARDQYDNPVGGVTVSARTSSGALAKSTVTTDADGRAAFRFQSTDVTGSSQRSVSVDLSIVGPPDAGYDSGSPTNVTMGLTVDNTDGSGLGASPGVGAYSVSWADPSTGSANPGAAFGSCTADACTWDVGASATDELDLTAAVSPSFEGIDLEFAVTDTAVGTLSAGSGFTDSSGASGTTLTARANGTIDVLASANEGSDVITVDVTNVGAGGQPPAPESPTISTRVDDLTRQDDDDPAFIASYDLGNVDGAFERVEISLDPPNGATTSQSRQTARGGVRFDPDSGAGDSFAITFDVIYTDADGSEYVAASRTVTDVADAANPSGNADLSTATSVELTSWSVVDRSQTQQNRPRFRYTYRLTDTGSFSEVRAHALNVPGTGADGVATYTQRSRNNQEIQLSDGGGDAYRIGFVVRDGDGTVVDAVSRMDEADGDRTYSGS